MCSMRNLEEGGRVVGQDTGNRIGHDRPSVPACVIRKIALIILRIQARMGLLALSNIGVTHEQGPRPHRLSSL